MSACRPGSDRGGSVTCDYSLKPALSCILVSQRLSTVSGIFGALAEQSRNSGCTSAGVRAVPRTVLPYCSLTLREAAAVWALFMLAGIPRVPFA
jgi:hypothetical protein